MDLIILTTHQRYRHHYSLLVKFYQLCELGKFRICLNKLSKKKLLKWIVPICKLFLLHDVNKFLLKGMREPVMEKHELPTSWIYKKQ